MFRNKQRLIESSNKPVLATLVLNFLEKSEQNIRAAAKVKGRSYKNIISASNDGLSMKSIGPALISALDEASLNAAAANTPSGAPPIPKYISTLEFLSATDITPETSPSDMNFMRTFNDCKS